MIEAQNRVDRLFPGFLDERARVHHDEISFVSRLSRGHAVGDQRAFELVAIDLVLRTSEGLDEIRARYRYRGSGQVYRISHWVRLAPRHRRTLVPRVLPRSRSWC